MLAQFSERPKKNEPRKITTGTTSLRSGRSHQTGTSSLRSRRPSYRASSSATPFATPTGTSSLCSRRTKPALARYARVAERIQRAWRVIPWTRERGSLRQHVVQVASSLRRLMRRTARGREGLPAIPCQDAQRTFTHLSSGITHRAVGPCEDRRLEGLGNGAPLHFPPLQTDPTHWRGNSSCLKPRSDPPD
jgi:hypothetical protein